MSLASIAVAATDTDLASRTRASVQKEARANPEFGDTLYGQQVKNNTVDPWSSYSYVIAVATEAAYESALASSVERPGLDPAVITDGDIGSTVQANWPADPAPPS